LNHLETAWALICNYDAVDDNVSVHQSKISWKIWS